MCVLGRVKAGLEGLAGLIQEGQGKGRHRCGCGHRLGSGKLAVIPPFVPSLLY